METGISNFYVTSILKPTCETFHGVFSADTIPTQLLQRDIFSIVCNLSKVDEPGSHFVTIISQPHKIFYIDSLGLPCVTPAIDKFLRKLRKPVFFNRRQIQHVSSKFCGFYCILFVLYFDRKETSPLRFESTNLLLNDRVCVKKIQEILNKMIY